MALSKTNHKYAQDLDYRLDNLNTLISAAKDLPYYLETTAAMSPETPYSLSPNKRSRLLSWVIEMLDNFSHDCQNPKNCQYRCRSKCPNSCSIRCSDTCEKPRVLSSKTRQLTFLLIDSFLSQTKVVDKELQLLATAAFFLATKIEESFYITLEDMRTIGGKIYTVDKISEMEFKVLKTLKWKLQMPTPTEITSNLLVIFDMPSEIDLDLFLRNVDNYIEFCLLEYEISRFGLITVALTSLICAFQQIDGLEFGEQLVMAACQYFNLNKENIRDCIKLTTKIINEHAMTKTASVKKCQNEDNFDHERRDNCREKPLVMVNESKEIQRKIDMMDIQDVSIEEVPSRSGRKEERMEVINEKTENSSSQFASSYCDDYLVCQSPCLELLQSNKSDGN